MGGVGGGGRAQNSDTVTGGGEVLTRSKGVSRWENVTEKKTSKLFIERLQLDGSANNN